jgi:hypothetical protein
LQAKSVRKKSGHDALPHTSLFGRTSGVSTVNHISTCGICGDLVRSETGANLHPRLQAHQALRDMQAHLSTHSFAELLRYEIRQDLDQVPEEQRPAIVRDIYRSLLGRTRDKHFSLNDPDGRGVYSIDEALGSLAVYQLWRTASRCGEPACAQHH